MESVGFGRFDIVRLLGSGSSCQVFEVRKNCGLDINHRYALKSVTRTIHSKNSEDALFRELETYVHIGSAGCTKYQSSFFGLQHFIETDTHLGLVLDFMCGDLFEYLRVNTNVSFEEKRFMLAEIVVGLERLHTMNIIHTDMKIENIMISSDGHLKLGDFGFSTIVSSNERPNHIWGTHFSPEMKAKRGHSFSHDWWCLGLMAFEILTSFGTDPFTIKCINNIYDSPPLVEILKEENFFGVFSIIPKEWQKVSHDFVSSLLRENENERLGFKCLSQFRTRDHPFFNGVCFNQVESATSPPCIKMNHQAMFEFFSEESTSTSVDSFRLGKNAPDFG